MKDFDSWARELADSLAQGAELLKNPAIKQYRILVGKDGNYRQVPEEDHSFCYCEDENCPHDHHEENCACGRRGRVNFFVGDDEDDAYYFCGGSHPGCRP